MSFFGSKNKDLRDLLNGRTTLIDFVEVEWKPTRKAIAQISEALVQAMVSIDAEETKNPPQGTGNIESCP